MKTTEFDLAYMPHDIQTRAKTGKGIETSPPLSVEEAEQQARQARK